MPKPSLPLTLLSLFASPDRAQSIEGDLLEEARTRGRLWFWANVLRTTAALWTKAFRDSTLELLGLTVACGGLWLGMLVLGFVARAGVEAAAESLGMPLSMRALVPFVIATFLAGIVWMRLAPLRGMYASMAVVVATFPVVTAMYVTGRPIEGIEDVMIQLAAGALTVAPLLIGSALSRRRIAGGGTVSPS